MSLAGWTAEPRLAGERGRSDTGEFKERCDSIALAMILTFFGLVARLFHLQIIEGEDHRAAARENIVRLRATTITVPRPGEGGGR